MEAPSGIAYQRQDCFIPDDLTALPDKVTRSFQTFLKMGHCNCHDAQTSFQLFTLGHKFENKPLRDRSLMMLFYYLTECFDPNTLIPIYEKIEVVDDIRFASCLLRVIQKLSGMEFYQFYEELAKDLDPLTSPKLYQLLKVSKRLRNNPSIRIGVLANEIGIIRIFRTDIEALDCLDRLLPLFKAPIVELLTLKTGLEDVKINDYDTTTQQLKFLKDILKTNSCVKEVAFAGQSINPESAILLADIIKQSHLKLDISSSSFVFNGMFGFNISPLVTVLEALADKNSKIEAIDLRRIPLHQEGTTSLNRTLLNVKSPLTSLKFSVKGLDSIQVPNMAKALQYNLHLTDLHIDGFYTSPTISNKPEKTAELKEQAQKIYNEILIPLLKAIEHNKTLKVVTLQELFFIDETCLHAIQSMIENGSMKKLSLIHFIPRESPENAWEDIFHSIKMNKSLEELDLSTNNYKDKQRASIQDATQKRIKPLILHLMPLKQKK